MWVLNVMAKILLEKKPSFFYLMFNFNEASKIFVQNNKFGSNKIRNHCCLS